MHEVKTSPETGASASHEKYVSGDLPVFKGHFPGMPLVPAAMLLEWMLESLPGGDNPDAGWTVLQAKFTKAVEPGMRILIASEGEDLLRSVTITGPSGTHATAKFKRDR